MEALWHKVYTPVFPTPENQTLESWCEVLQKDTFMFDSETVLIGHSLWALYILHILDMERKAPIRKAILVSWFTWELEIEQFDDLNRPFLKDDFEWDRLKSNAQEYVVFHGSDDPYVPMHHAQNLTQKLWAELIMINGGGHLNESSGYTEFGELLEVL